MLDTLSLALTLALAPVSVDSAHAIVKPARIAPIMLARAEETAPNNYTTCFENNAGSCWGKD